MNSPERLYIWDDGPETKRYREAFRPSLAHVLYHSKRCTLWRRRPLLWGSQSWLQPVFSQALSSPRVKSVCDATDGPAESTPSAHEQLSLLVFHFEHRRRRVASGGRLIDGQFVRVQQRLQPVSPA